MELLPVQLDLYVDNPDVDAEWFRSEVLDVDVVLVNPLVYLAMLVLLSLLAMAVAKLGEDFEVVRADLMEPLLIGS